MRIGLAAVLLALLSAPTFAEDLYEECHGGFGSGLWRGMPVKPRTFGPAPERSYDPIIRRGLGDYDHDGMFDRFDFDRDNFNYRQFEAQNGDPAP